MRLDPDDDLGRVDMDELVSSIRRWEVTPLDLLQWLNAKLELATNSGYDYGYADGAAGSPKGTAWKETAIQEMESDNVPTDAEWEKIEREWFEEMDRGLSK
jgi:hypothetical protein